MKSLLLVFLFITPFYSTAQLDTVAVKSIKGITDKMLEMISVEIGEDPNWEEYRMLFTPTAQKTSVNPNAPKGRQVRTFTIEQFIRLVGPSYSRDGFYEVATDLVITGYGPVVNVAQSYESKNLTGTYESNGVNFYQLVYADDRWWIANTVFTAEDENNPLPNGMFDSE